MTLSLIFARSEDHCIGKGGGIPWRLPADFAHFKCTTIGKPIIMGRKTYEDHESALPGRLNLVVTRQAGYEAAAGVVVVDSIEAAVARAKEDSADYFVIGGAAFFEQSMPHAQTVYETVVHTTVEGGDTFLPAFDFTGWQTQELQHHPTDERHAFAFTVYRHDRA